MSEASLLIVDDTPENIDLIVGLLARQDLDVMAAGEIQLQGSVVLDDGVGASRTGEVEQGTLVLRHVERVDDDVLGRKRPGRGQGEP